MSAKTKTIVKAPKEYRKTRSAATAAGTTAVTAAPRVRKTLMEIFTSLKNPAAFGSAANLYREAREKIPGLTQKQVDVFLTSVPSYTMHRRVYVKFPRRKVITSGIDTQWQADLVDMRSVEKENDSFKYLLTIIDVFSRQAWVQPLKDKYASSVLEAFNRVLNESGRQPVKLQTDDGKEFVSKIFQNGLKERKIIWFSTQMLVKAQIVERFNRTLKDLIHRYMTQNGTLRYIDKLGDFISVYNRRPHRGIGGIPPQNVTANNRDKVYNIQYANHLAKKRKYLKKRSKYNVGDTVRLSKYRGKFTRGYTRNYRSEIFCVRAVLDTYPRTYKLETCGKKREEIDGSFYAPELVPASF